MVEPSSDTAPRPALTDSPWFWVMLFAVAGLIVLLVVSPKYGRRQRKLELEYHAGQEINRRNAAGELPTREIGDEGDALPPPRDELLVPLWPLAVLLLALAVTSSVMLVRGRQGGRLSSPPARKVEP